MKTLKTLMIVPILGMAFSGSAQDEISRLIDQLLETENPCQVLQGRPYDVDVVSADFTTQATKLDRKAGEAYLRIAEFGPNGWLVRILAPDGTVLMTGHFADTALSLPDGLFAFYYDNGQVESAGMYEDGMKKGLWQRYTAWGTHLAERIYDGLGADEMLLKNRLGHVAKAQ